MKWANDHCFPKIGFSSGKKVWCLNCGSVHSTSEKKCPNCGVRISIKESLKRKFYEENVFTIVTTHKGFQVVRNFQISKTSIKGSGPVFDYYEVVQNWITDKGVEVVVARSQSMNWNKLWSLGSDLTIKTQPSSYSIHKGIYDIASMHIFPKHSVIPKLKRNGFKSPVRGVASNNMAKSLLTDNFAEMLLKSGQQDLFIHRVKCPNSEYFKKFGHAIKIANRNGYRVSDATMWFDYLSALELAGRDTHNAYYVCPSNLKEAHDKAVAQRQKQQARIDAERKKAEAEKYEAQYQSDKGCYFGICFGNDRIQISVITSVADMAEEGAYMHHCVYNMNYYSKPKSLILSARDKRGERLETIELNLDTFQVVQSRGICNQYTEYHDEIVSLVERNIEKFRNVAKNNAQKVA